MRQAAHFCSFASAAYGPFGALLVSFTRGEFCSTAWQLLKGIAFCHDNRVLHRCVTRAGDTC